MRRRSGYAVNGLFLTRQAMGIERYAFELLRELDILVEPGELQVVAPESCVNPGYRNIEFVCFGKRSGIAWEQVDFARYLRKHRMKGVNLCNTLPLASPWGITTIHDISYKVNPQFFKRLRNRLSRRWHVVNYWTAIRFCEHIITVSEFSKSEILRVYGVKDEQISVIGNAWQHMERINADPTVVKRLGLEDGEYFFSMSSLAPNKNIGWIIETARINPETTFVIAGSSKLAESFPDAPGNVVFAGFVSDGEAKALMACCRAFLFPTLYEGFGIPPLEALACGAPIVVSDTPCMHEVYGDAAAYINPVVPADDLELLMDSSGRLTESILLRFSWSESARLISRILHSSGLSSQSRCSVSRGLSGRIEKKWQAKDGGRRAPQNSASKPL